MTQATTQEPSEEAGDLCGETIHGNGPDVGCEQESAKMQSDAPKTRATKPGNPDIEDRNQPSEVQTERLEYAEV